MINNNIILNNPTISEGYYFAKVIQVESEPADYFFPKLLIKISLHPMYGLGNNSYFHAIIHPTNNSFYHYKNFFNAYMLGVGTTELEKAIGQWGSVEISHSDFNETTYSSVRFVYQPRAVMMEAWRIGRDERENDATI